ncbi:helix-turn-helix domain-containing protein [Paenibacillus hemerocallicola]|uniref:Helix-turn-helix domain-containing protein n=1 Tax=Paenibacillus hemerocallicola TaxID=1172614 RepID=A0A5C4T0S3_9BACL|nr:helix-turn-helix domain-containing protein [Paenibacillus hemerocallicola]
MLCVVTAGEGYLRLDGRLVSLQPCCAFFLRPSMKVEILVQSSCVECYLLRFGSVVLDWRQGSWSCTPGETSGMPLPPGKLPIRSIEPIAERIERMYRGLRSRPARSDGLQLQFNSLLQHMLDELSVPGESEKGEGGGIDQTIDYMYRHYKEKIRLDTLSHIAGLTQTSYSRSFKRAKGISPMEYLQHIRMDRSKRLLEQGHPIKEVSESAGFGNEFYFSRIFKQAFGMSPVFYIKRRHLRVAVACSFGYEDCLRSLGLEPEAVMNGGRNVEQTEEGHRLMVEHQLERFRRARPDLIIADSRHRPFYERLKQISPTVVLEYSADWRQMHRRIAELVGREKEAQQNFDQVEQKIHYAKNMLNSSRTSQSFSFMRLFRRKIRVQGLGQHPMNALLYTELGLRPGSSVPLDRQYREYDVGRVPPFDTDYLYIYSDLPSGSDTELLSRLGQNACWGGMNAFHNDRIRRASNWIRMSWSPIGQQRIMDELLQGET